MSNFIIFAVGLIVTLVAGLGVITSTVFMGYKKSITTEYDNHKNLSHKPV